MFGSRPLIVTLLRILYPDPAGRGAVITYLMADWLNGLHPDLQEEMLNQITENLRKSLQ